MVAGAEELENYPPQPGADLPFRAFIESLPTLVFVTAGNSPNVYVNERFRKYTGLSRERLTGPGWMDALHPDDILTVFAAWDAAQADGAEYEVEYRLRSAAGEYRWHLARAVPMAWAGKPAAFWVGKVTDVHDRVMAQAAARDTAAQLELAQAAAGVGTFDLDLLTGELRWSDGCKRAFGLTPADEITLERFFALLADADRDAVRAAMERAIDPATASDQYEAVYRAIWPDGSVRWIDARGRAIFTGDGAARRATHLVGAVIDVTERKAAEERLADALAAKEVLLAEVNHRIKNNLQIVTALLGLQANRLGAGEGRAALLEAQSRVAVVASIHERLYMGGGHDRLDLARFAEDLLLDVLRSSGAERQVALRLDAASGIEIGVATAVPLGIVLNELATNAVKYAWRSGDRGELLVRIGRAGADLRIEIADDGQGLPAGFQLSDAQGLGLRIVGALVRQMRGEVDTGAGGGASFRLTIPLEA